MSAPIETTDISIDPAGLRVTVRELIGHNCWIDGTPVELMRRRARNSAQQLIRDEIAAAHELRQTGNDERIRNMKIISSHIVNRFVYGGCDHITFLITTMNRKTRLITQGE